MLQHVGVPAARLAADRYANAVARAPTHLSLRSSLTSSAKMSNVRRAGKMYCRRRESERMRRKEREGGEGEGRGEKEGPTPVCQETPKQTSRRGTAAQQMRAS